jgi:hypothetical protein
VFESRRARRGSTCSDWDSHPFCSGPKPETAMPWAVRSHSIPSNDAVPPNRGRSTLVARDDTSHHGADGYRSRS